MNQELERYKTLCVAQEAEIARLTCAIKELKEWAGLEHDNCLNGEYTDYHRGGFVMTGLFIENINRITGENE